MFIVLNRVLFNEFSISNNIQSSLKRKLTTRLTFGHPYRRCVDIVVCMCVSVISLYAYSHHCIYSITIWHIKRKKPQFSWLSGLRVAFQNRTTFFIRTKKIFGQNIHFSLLIIVSFIRFIEPNFSFFFSRPQVEHFERQVKIDSEFKFHRI